MELQTFLENLLQDGYYLRSHHIMIAFLAISLAIGFLIGVTLAKIGYQLTQSDKRHTTED